MLRGLIGARMIRSAERFNRRGKGRVIGFELSLGPKRFSAEAEKRHLTLTYGYKINPEQYPLALAEAVNWSVTI